MDVQNAIDEAAKGKLVPIYAIHGEERTLVTRAIEAIRKATVGGGPRAISEDHFDAANVRPAQVVDACRMLPMLSRWRLVLVRQIDEWKAEDYEQLLPYVNAPTPSTVLILLADKLDGRLRFAMTLKKKGYIFEAHAPSERELVPWLETEARRRGTSFASGAAASLTLAIGADLGALSDALDRLQLFAGDRPITERDVDETVVSVREASQFELSDAVGERNLPRALSLVHQLMRQREPGLLVLTFVARQIRLLARARETLERGGDLAAALRLPPFVAGKVGGQSKRWTAAQLVRALRICARADARLKSGGGRDRDARVLEELVLALCGGAGMGEGALAG